MPVRHPPADRGSPARALYLTSVRHLGTLAAAARARGIDAEGAWGRAGLDPLLLQDVTAFVEGPRARSFAADLAGRARDVPLGLLAADAFASMDLGPLGLLLEHAVTLREAILFGVHYSALLDGSNGVQLLEAGREARLRIAARFEPFVLPVLAEHALGFVACISWRLSERTIVPFEVCFAHARAHSLGVYERFFRGPVRFESAHNEIAFPITYLDLRLPRARRRAPRALLDRVGAMIPSPGDGRLEGRVRSAVAEALASPRPDFGDLAERIGIDRRVLNVRLRAEGTSIPRIIEAARRELGIAYVRDPRVSIDLVARQLGYADRSAFARAFRRWTRASPMAYRRSGQCLSGSGS